MFNNLRSRFILSHTLPLLLMIPLVGLALIYFLESQVLLPNLARELYAQATLLAEIASEHTDIWSDPAKAQAFVNRYRSSLPARVQLLDGHGNLIASSDPADQSRVAQPVVHAGMSDILAGQISVHTDYSQHLDAEVADAFIPLIGPNHQVLGVIRLTHQLVNVYADFLRLRYFVAGILGVALLLGASVGLVLALNLERPLTQATLAIQRLAVGQELVPLSEQGTVEIRTLLQAFNVLMTRLRDLEEMRRQLLSNLVHELGTPLGALNAAIQAMRGGAAEEPALRQEMLLGMQEEVGHLRRLLDDLARLYDQVLGGVELNRRPVALSEWLPRVLATWREAALDKNLKWEANLPPDLPRVEADPDRLAQILGNLMSNAIKYTEAGGRVSVTARREGEEACICVSDTGRGIPADEQALVFNPFYRGREAGRFPEGMGLGLTIARDLALAHGGRVEVESRPGQGSRFKLWLPVALA